MNDPSKGVFPAPMNPASEIENMLIHHMKEIMLKVALDETISEEERTEKLARGREYIAARGRLG